MTHHYLKGSEAALEKLANPLGEIAKGEELYSRILKLILSIEKRLPKEPTKDKTKKPTKAVTAAMGTRG